MTTTHIATEHIEHPRSQKLFRTIKLLVGAYIGLNAVALLAVVVDRHSKSITDTVWTRTVILLCTSFLLWLLVARMAQGGRRAYLRVRLISSILLASVIVIVAIPGSLPTWLKGEQVACGLLLLYVVLLTNSHHLRSIFTAQ